MREVFLVLAKKKKRYVCVDEVSVERAVLVCSVFAAILCA